MSCCSLGPVLLRDALAGDVGVLEAPQRYVCHSLPVWQAGEHRGSTGRVTEAHGWVSRDPNVMETNCSGYQTQWGGKLLHAPVFLPVPLPLLTLLHPHCQISHSLTSS